MNLRIAIKFIAGLLVSPGIAGASGWDLPDPTRPPSVEAPRGGSELQTTLVSPGRKLAIISGRTVGVGDRVGAAVVTDIRPYEVVLKTSSGEKVLRLAPPINIRRNEIAPYTAQEPTL